MCIRDRLKCQSAKKYSNLRVLTFEIAYTLDPYNSRVILKGHSKQKSEKTPLSKKHENGFQLAFLTPHI